MNKFENIKNYFEKFEVINEEDNKCKLLVKNNIFNEKDVAIDITKFHEDFYKVTLTEEFKPKKELLEKYDLSYEDNKIFSWTTEKSLIIKILNLISIAQEIYFFNQAKEKNKNGR